MLSVFAPPAALSRWNGGAVALRFDAGPAHTHFPGVPHAMLTMQWVNIPAAAKACQAVSIRFHTLTTKPSLHRHEGPVRALGLLIKPAAAACLLKETSGQLPDQG